MGSNEDFLWDLLMEQQQEFSPVSYIEGGQSYLPADCFDTFDLKWWISWKILVRPLRGTARWISVGYQY